MHSYMLLLTLFLFLYRRDQDIAFLATCSLHSLLNASLLFENGPPLLDFEDLTVVLSTLLPVIFSSTDSKERKYFPVGLKTYNEVQHCFLCFLTVGLVYPNELFTFLLTGRTVFGMVFNVIAILVQDFDAVVNKGFFHGYSAITVLMIFNHAASVVRYHFVKLLTKVVRNLYEFGTCFLIQLMLTTRKHGIFVVKLRKTPNSDNMKHDTVRKWVIYDVDIINLQFMLLDFRLFLLDICYFNL